MKLHFRYVIFLMPVLLASLLVPAGAQTGKLAGKVKEKSGKVLEGVTVRATNAKNKDDKREIKTDSKGEFEFDALPGGDYSLSFEKQGFKTFNTRKLEITPGETQKVGRVVELEREGTPYSVIRGATFHGPGYSLPNATVLIERIDGQKKFKQETTSHDGGEFAFRLRAERAKYRVTATARGYQSASTEIEIESDEVRNIALTLQPAK